MCRTVGTLGRMPVQLVIFELGDQRFGLVAEDVREVVCAVSITPLPKAPA